MQGQFAVRLESQRRLLLMLTDEIGSVEVALDKALRNNPHYRALQKIRGIGPVLAAIFVAEIGDITRFPTADALACWAGITPRHLRLRPDRASRAHQQGRLRPGALGRR